MKGSVTMTEEFVWSYTRKLNDLKLAKERVMSTPDYVQDIARNFIKHPLTQHKASFSASEAAGSVELAALRGEQNGRHEAYLAIKGKYPAAARALLKQFNMNDDGDIKL
jgi:hypothetical protein